MSFERRSLPLSPGAVAAACLALLLSACGTQPPAPQPLPVPPPKPAPAPAPVPAPAPAPAPVPAPPAKTEFVPVPFSALPGWDRDDLRAAWPAFTASCRALGKRPDWQEACSVARTVDASDEQAIRQYFETFFEPQRVIAPDGSDSGLVTGYYEPLLHGARKKGGPYQTPLYKVPDDLLIVDLGSVYPELKGKRLRGRLQGRKVIPYQSRADIAQADFKGKELLWVDDPVEAFFLEVQGSGRVQLADTKETVRVAYADQNGHPYKAIGKWLIEQGELTPEQATAQGIKGWIAGHPTRMQELFNANPSYVFFREEKLPDPSVGPKGTLGVPLTPQRSVAIDPAQLPLGAPLYLSTTQAASDVPMQRLVMAQDTGGAIKGAIRVDFFFGFATEAAENAGRMKQRGQVWVLLPKAAR
ncbi:murein transglycosylase A [Massilia endophytica]|uniref:murein transglycosylase A n=1 Tax=Massilia endophytica TaxID=2899220 RepID=UPI001E318C69|nr:murein transglycosylase A [Massilia endophytica]UGQ46972.1 murein transglycosylase A [Massilia endophytica]